MNTRFLIVASGYNCAPFVEKCIASIKAQTYNNFDYILIDDNSTDATLPLLYANTSSGKIISLSKRTGTIRAHDYGIRAKDAEVIVWLDLDDHLMPNALERLAKEYEDPECWLTYGNYIDYNGETFFTKENINYSEEVHAANSYRQADWKYIHLRSFRRELYLKLSADDLYLPDHIIAYIDYNLWICLLELAGKEHIRAITDVLYRYNNMNPLNLLRSYTGEQREVEIKFCKAITPKEKLKSL